MSVSSSGRTRSGSQQELRWLKLSPHRWYLWPRRASLHRGCPSPPCPQRTTQVSRTRKFWEQKYLNRITEFKTYLREYVGEGCDFYPLSSLRVPADQRGHHCFTRSGITWWLVANQCVHMATAAGCFSATPATATTTASTATTTATTN